QVPATVVTYVAQQLGLDDPTCLEHYHSRDTHWDHATEIQKSYGYRDFHNPREAFRLVRWLYSRAWLSAERPSVLFDLATARLVERKVLLPGVTTMERLVARVRERVAARLWQQLTQVTNADQQANLDTLLQVPAGEHTTLLDRLRRAPSRVSGPELVAALHRVEAMRALGVSDISLDHLPLNRLRALARYAAAARAQAISRMAPERRTATLLAFAHAFERTAMDDAIDVFDGLVSDIVRGAHKEGEKERLRTLHDLDSAALQLWDALQVLLDHTVKPLKLAPCGRTVLVHHVPGSLPTSPSNPQSCQCELSHELFPIPVSAHVWGDTAAGTITPSLDLVQFVIDHAITWMPHFPDHHLPATPSTTKRITPRTDKHARAVGCLRRDTI